MSRRAGKGGKRDGFSSTPAPRLRKLADGAERFIDWTGRTTAWLTLAMAGAMFLIVVLRYVFNEGSIALQESVTHMFALSFLLGAAYTLKHDGHVRVDIFYRQMQPRRKAWVDTLGICLLLLPSCVFIFVVSWPYVLASWQILEGSREPGGLPGVFLIKTAILFSVALLIVQALIQLYENVAFLWSRDAGPSPAQDTETHAL